MQHLSALMPTLQNIQDCRIEHLPNDAWHTDTMLTKLLQMPTHYEIQNELHTTLKRVNSIECSSLEETGLILFSSVRNSIV